MCNPTCSSILLLLSVFSFHRYSSATFFLKSPGVEVREVGSNVTFHCLISTASSNIYWIINNRRAEQYDTVHVTTSTSYSILTVDDVTLELNGHVCCCFIIKVEGQSCGRLQVKLGPFINGGPDNQTANESSAIILECGVKAFPAPTIDWLFNDQRICDAKKYSSHGRVECSSVSKTVDFHESIIKISNLTINDSGPYSCNASTQFGRAFSKAGWVKVTEIELGSSPRPSTTIQHCKLKNTTLSAASLATTVDFQNAVPSSTFEATYSTVQDDQMSSLSTTPSDDGYHDHETPNPNGKIFLYLLLGITVCAILVIIIFLSYRRRKKFKGKSSKLKMRLKSTKEFYASDSKYASLEAMKYPLKKLTYIEELGKGVFGIVFKASAPGLLDPHETTTVAVKVLRSSDRHNKTKLENFAQEANLISTYKHPNLIQLLGVCTEENCPRHASGAICCLLFEYMDGGDLCALLRRHGPNRELFKANSNTRDICLTDKKKLIWCSQIACGMQYLSERNFIHRDLATRNCLLSSKDWTVKIADFGLSRCTYESDYYTAGSAEAVPIRWMSPEAILYGRYSWQSDVWAFGVTLWEIYTYALQPYYSLSNEEVVHQVCEGNTLPKPPDAPDWMFNLMKLCWQTSPDDRPNFITIYSVLEAIYLNNGLMPNTYPQSYVQQTIAETQLHSNGNDRNEMRLPGWNMADWALPPPRQFSSVHSDQVSSISADRVTQNSNLPNIAMQSAGGIVQWSRHNNSDSCLPDSPSSIPSLSVN